jgi:hypothetical protein
VRTTLAGVLLAGLIAGGCSTQVTPSPIATTPSPAPATPRRTTTKAPVVALPSGAPLSLAECSWPAGTPLAFAGTIELRQVGLPDAFGNPHSTKRVFAIVSSDPIAQHPMIGPPTQARGVCARGADGSLSVSTVPDNWRPPAG